MEKVIKNIEVYLDGRLVGHGDVIINMADEPPVLAAMAVHLATQPMELKLERTVKRDPTDPYCPNWHGIGAT